MTRGLLCRSCLGHVDGFQRGKSYSRPLDSPRPPSRPFTPLFCFEQAPDAAPNAGPDDANTNINADANTGADTDTSTGTGTGANTDTKTNNNSNAEGIEC